MINKEIHLRLHYTQKIKRKNFKQNRRLDFCSLCNRHTKAKRSFLEVSLGLLYYRRYALYL